MGTNFLLGDLTSSKNLLCHLHPVVIVSHTSQHMTQHTLSFTLAPLNLGLETTTETLHFSLTFDNLQKLIYFSTCALRGRFKLSYVPAALLRQLGCQSISPNPPFSKNDIT